jgi:hypothetical protein
MVMMKTVVLSPKMGANDFFTKPDFTERKTQIPPEIMYKKYL